MTFPILTVVVLIAALLIHRYLLSFSAQKPRDYAGTEPAFDIQKHLSGPMQSEGVIYGPTGRVSVRFVAEMRGSWNGATGSLEESFNYAAGNSQARKWNLKMGENGAFTATADDVIGVGHGQQTGSAVRLTYRLKLSDDAGGHVLNVTDWLYLMDNGNIMNRSEMRKFGIKVAELIATIRPDRG